MTQDDKNALITAIIAFACIILFWVVQSSIEAASYNRVTGSSVSTWDAMFLDLRVYGEPK